MRKLKSIKCLRLNASRIWHPVFNIYQHQFNYLMLINLIKASTLFYYFVIKRQKRKTIIVNNLQRKLIYTTILFKSNQVLLLHNLNTCE